MQRNDLILFGALVAAFLTIFLVALVQAYPTSGVAAAWAQAVFSIIGIAVAIAVPTALALSEKRERKERRLERSGSLAMSLIGAIWLLEAETDRATKVLYACQNAPPGPISWTEWFDALTLEIPEILLSSIPLMIDTQENIVGPFRLSAVMAMTFNGYVGKFRLTPWTEAEKKWSELFNLIARNLQLTRDSIASAQALVNEVRDQQQFTTNTPA